MTNTQILAKESFSKLRRLILSDDFSNSNIDLCNETLRTLFEEHPPQINDIQSIKELDMISMFGFQLCKSKLDELSKRKNARTGSFRHLLATIDQIEDAITEIMDFKKLSDTLEKRMEQLL